jgi:hypothetical protein
MLVRHVLRQPIRRVPTPEKAVGLGVAAALLCLFVFTNDLHRQLFSYTYETRRPGEIITKTDGVITCRFSGVFLWPPPGLTIYSEIK